MDHHDPGAAGVPGAAGMPGTAGPRRDRRRHASARRGRGPVWLLAGGGATVLGLAAALLAGGLGKSGGARSPVDDGADGPPSMIQADPSDGTSDTSGAAGAAASGGSSGGGATSVPGVRTSAPAPSAKTTAGAAPSETATTAPDASPTAGSSVTDTASADVRTEKPGKGRGGSKRPR
ncbi:hypothetical protein ABZ318_14715 [Streptomyces sp. NPDC006197]|uniref:hypothetical protein n=1 Tax=Streptomyces sp. NPDC006197 TaxID=3156685 RepID=UPI0033B6BD62